MGHFFSRWPRRNGKRMTYQQYLQAMQDALWQGLQQGLQQQGYNMGVTSASGMQGFGDAQFPDIIASSLFGQRYWNINSEQMLTSITKNEYQWVPGKNEAICLRNKDIVGLEMMGRTQPNGTMSAPFKLLHETESLPIDVCGCGFWAYWSEQNAVRQNNKTAVAGVMEGWGKLIVGPNGFRAQYARIVALCPPTEAKAWLNLPAMRAQYPGVKWYDDFEEMVAMHPTPNAFRQLDVIDYTD
jgi:hypothetical protein